MGAVGSNQAYAGYSKQCCCSKGHIATSAIGIADQTETARQQENPRLEELLQEVLPKAQCMFLFPFSKRLYQSNCDRTEHNCAGLDMLPVRDGSFADMK